MPAVLVPRPVPFRPFEALLLNEVVVQGRKTTTMPAPEDVMQGVSYREVTIVSSTVDYQRRDSRLSFLISC